MDNNCMMAHNATHLIKEALLTVILVHTDCYRNK